MKTSITKFKHFVIYGIILCYSASCNLDSLSDMDPVQQEVAEGSQGELDQTEAHLRLGSLLFEEGFVGGKAFAGQSLQFAGDHSFQVVSDPHGSDNKVGRFELRQNDAIVKGSKRAEIGFRDELREGWYGYSVYFPSTGFERDSHPEILAQWHQSGGGSPPNSFEVWNDEMYFRSINRSDTRDNSNKVYTNYSLGKVQRGMWHEFVFHIVHSPNSDGLIEVWHNNIKVHTVKGPNMRRDFPLPTLKVGIYKWSWAGQKTNTDRRIVYFDNVRVGGKGAGLADFANGALPSLGNAVGGVVAEAEKEKKQSGSEPQIITGFNLIQANTDEDLGAVSNGGVVANGTHKLNIRANTASSFKGEVRFKLSGAASHTYIDAGAPFSLFGDNGRGDYYFGGGLYPGTYTLEAVPYKEGKVAGKAVRIKFTVKK